MAVALEHAEVGVPWANGVAVLVRHDAGYLVQMGEVVDGPCGEELRERDCSEGWMLSWAGKIAGLQVKRLQGGEALASKRGELV
jgi:hypothetical protein